MNEVDVTKLSATIPWGNVEEVFQVYDLQKSSSCALPLRQGPNQVLTENGETYLAFHHMASERFPLLPPDYGTSSPLKFEPVLMLIFINLSWKRFFLKMYMTFSFTRCLF